jgi:hypothetical protein
MSHRCSDCRGPMDESLVELSDGVYVAAWRCPNRDNHGATVECPNCGEQVPSQSYHATWTDGLYGSFRYHCMRPLPPICYAELSEPKYEALPPGVRPIKLSGKLVCSQRKPCPIHDVVDG